MNSASTRCFLDSLHWMSYRILSKGVVQMKVKTKSRHRSMLFTGWKAMVGIAVLLLTVGTTLALRAATPEGKTPDSREQIRQQIVATIKHPQALVITDNLSGDDANTLMNSTTPRLDSNIFGKYHLLCGDGRTMYYRLFKPATTPGKKYPLLIYYNGSNNEGSDNTSQLLATVSPRLYALPEIQKQYPCYIAVPQLPANLGKDWKTIAAAEHKEVYTLLLKSYPDIDQKRIYLAGFSAGASLVYLELSLNPDFFAAGLAADGTADIANWPAIYAAHYIPLLMFCGGSKDPINPARNGLVIEKTAEALGGKLTCVSFPNLDHWQVGNTFMQEPGVLDWLFAQHK